MLADKKASNTNPYAPPVGQSADSESEFDNHQVAKETFTSPRALTTALNALLVVCVLLSVGSVVVRFVVIKSIFRVLTEEQASAAEVHAIDLGTNFLAFSYMAVRSIAGIVFFFWTYRVSKNLPALGIVQQHFSPAWAVGSNFVPVLNLWLPLLALLEIWRGSDPGRLPNSQRKIQADRWLGVWWVLHTFEVMFAALAAITLVSEPPHEVELSFLNHAFMILRLCLFTIPRDLLQILWGRKLVANQLARRKLIEQAAETIP